MNVRKRVQKLETAGYIKGYKAIINHDLIDNNHIAFVQIKLNDTKTMALNAFNKAIKEVSEVELSIINNYMPKQLSEAEIEAAVDKAISDSGADSMKDMGKLMGILKGQLDGQADMGLVSQLIKSKLS